MRNPEDYISYKSGLLLKELGYRHFCTYFYARTTPDADVTIECNYPAKGDWNDSNYVKYSTCKYDIHCSAPTLAEASKWLREQGYYVHVSYSLAYSKWIYTVDKIDGKGSVWVRIHSRKTYEAALSAGIEKALQVIKKQRNLWPQTTSS